MGWVVNAKFRPLYPRERHSTHCIGGWVGPRDGLENCGKFRFTKIRSPYPPARSQSLHRLHYSGSLKFIYLLLKAFVFNLHKTYLFSTKNT